MPFPSQLPLIGHKQTQIDQPVSMSVVSWNSRQNLPFDLVDGFMQDLDAFDAAAVVPTCRQEMVRRQINFVMLRHGFFQEDNFTYRSKATPILVHLMAQAMPSVAPYVRRVSVRFRTGSVMNNNSAIAGTLGQSLQRLVQNSPLLSSVELIGHDTYGDQGTSAINHVSLCAQVFQGLAANRGGRFSCLCLSGMQHIESDEINTNDATKEALVKSLAQLTTLHSVVLDDCNADFAALIFQGLKHHATLTSLTLRINLCEAFCFRAISDFLSSLPSLASLTLEGTILSRIIGPTNRQIQAVHSIQLVQSIPELPNLKSFYIGEDITKAVDAIACLSRCLQYNLPNLNSLSLPKVLASHSSSLTRALSEMTMLQDLCIDQVSSEALPVSVHFLTSRFSTNLSLDSLVSFSGTNWMSDARVSELLQRLHQQSFSDDENEGNNAPRASSLRSLSIHQGEIGPMAVWHLEQILQTQSNLRHLSVNTTSYVVEALCNIFAQNTVPQGVPNVRLISLRLVNIRTDLSSLLRVLAAPDIAKTPLKSLSLHFKKLLPETYATLCGELSPLIEPLKSLWIHFDGAQGSHPELGPHGSLAEAFVGNKSLTSLTILHNAQTQVAWNVLTQFVSQRNRIQQWAQSIEELQQQNVNAESVDSLTNVETRSLTQSSLWPYVLEGLVPDRTTIFVIIRDIFWPIEKAS